MPETLATVAAVSRLSNEHGRALITVRGQHFVTDSPPPLGGPNEAVNPAELLLAALAACATFVCDTAAREKNMPLKSIAVSASGDFDPRGVCGEPFDPRFQALRVRLTLVGVDQAQGEALVSAFKSRCPVFTTLSRIVPIEIAVG